MPSVIALQSPVLCFWGPEQIRTLDEDDDDDDDDASHWNLSLWDCLVHVIVYMNINRFTNESENAFNWFLQFNSNSSNDKEYAILQKQLNNSNKMQIRWTI